MFAVAAQTAPGVVAVGRAGVNNNSRGVRGTPYGGGSVRGVGGSNAHRSRVAMGGARRKGDALRMVRTAATEGESTACRDAYYSALKTFEPSTTARRVPPRQKDEHSAHRSPRRIASRRIASFFFFLVFLCPPLPPAPNHNPLSNP